MSSRHDTQPGAHENLEERVLDKLEKIDDSFQKPGSGRLLLAIILPVIILAVIYFIMLQHAFF